MTDLRRPGFALQQGQEALVLPEVVAAGIAAPLFIVTLVIVFIPRLMWGFISHIERLHDRDKSAWWLLLFYGVPVLLGPMAKMGSFARPLSAALHDIPALAGFALSIWDLLKSAACREPADPTAMAPIRFCRPDKPAG